MFLSQEEIIGLTGYKLYKYQIDWLRKNGINCLVGHDGRPKVLAAHLEEIMGKSKERQKRKIEPDFSMFDKGLKHVT